MKRSVSYIITVKTPYKSTRKILLRGETKLSALAECILDAYGIVRDRAYFFFMGKEPWDGAVYTDTAEFDKEFSACRVSVSLCMDEGDKFLFQIGYDPEFFFECKAEISGKAALAVPEIISASGGNVSEFLPSNEYEEEIEGEETEAEWGEADEELSDAEYSPLEIRIDQYLRAAVSLYGVLTKVKAREIILFYEPTLSDVEIKAAMRSLPRADRRGDYVFIGREAAYPELAEFQTGEYFALKKAQRGKPFYLPEKDEFLRYADPFYFEKTVEYDALESALKSEVASPAETAEDIFRMMSGGIEPDAAISVARKICKRDLLSSEIAGAVNALSHKIRRWENRGNY